MLYALGVLIVLAIIFGPSLWVKFVMSRYSTEKPEMPGTGGELAKHLVKRFSLKKFLKDWDKSSIDWDDSDGEMKIAIIKDIKNSLDFIILRYFE